jgi:hypothetical protein
MARQRKKSNPRKPLPVVWLNASFCPRIRVRGAVPHPGGDAEPLLGLPLIAPAISSRPSESYKFPIIL